MTNYTPAQLEAWAGLGPWVIVVDAHFPYNGHVRDQSKDEHVCGVFGEVEAIDEFDSTIIPDDNAALIASAPDLARLVLEKDAEIARKDKEIAELKAAAEDLVGLCHADVKMNSTTYQPMPYRSAFTKAVEHMIEAINTDRQAMKETSDDAS